MMMPASPAAGLVFVQPHVALFSLELCFNPPPRTAHIGQHFHRGVSGSVGNVVAGLAAVQVAAPDGPDLLAGLALPGCPHPPGVEHIAPRPLASLSHRYLPPSLLRQLSTPLLHGPALPLPELGFAGAPRPPIFRTAPCWLQGPDRRVARNVQHVAHPPGPPSPPGRTATSRRRRLRQPIRP